MKKSCEGCDQRAKSKVKACSPLLWVLTCQVRLHNCKVLIHSKSKIKAGQSEADRQALSGRFLVNRMRRISLELLEIGDNKRYHSERIRYIPYQ